MDECLPSKHDGLMGTDARVEAFSQDFMEPNAVKENLPLTNMRYVELHGGIDLGAESKWPFPGFSGLVGFRAGKHLFLDCQVGAAFPSLGTAKVGWDSSAPNREVFHSRPVTGSGQIMSSCSSSTSRMRDWSM